MKKVDYARAKQDRELFKNHFQKQKNDQYFTEIFTGSVDKSLIQLARLYKW